MQDSETSTRHYDFKAIESKWQKSWEESELFKATDSPDPDNKFYMLVMFAYPSGDIHMGHFRNYTIGDAVARYQMMRGKDLLHPFGWDAFGLPAERAAIKRNIHPDKWTKENIVVSRNTLKKVGISFDWSREVVTCNPDYYRWTQWMFVQLFKKGLAYRKRGFVNWCPEDKTVLANEQVVDGKCDRCGTEVVKQDQVQWYFKITEYADRLIDDLDKLPEWPDNLKAIQREWIGRSYGLEVDFEIEHSGEKLPIFTTRPDTIFGVTFMAISPESELLRKLNLEGAFAGQVSEYQKKAALRSDIERTSVTGEKDGVFTGRYAINPFNGEKVQLWVADYVLAGYGTGAVMAVPAHDVRDFSFARKYDIPIRVVIRPEEGKAAIPEEMKEAYIDYGPMVNSGVFDGKSGKEAIGAVSEHAEQHGFGRSTINYRLNDWSISRQRYWGCPIPIIHCGDCGEVPVEERHLPLLLPDVNNFTPKGRSPLADIPEYMKVACPECGEEARRDPDTMDTFVCSSWYNLRYPDPHNQSVPFDSAKTNAWSPVDLYVGGISHATGHLLYFRFFTKFLFDNGYINFDEPAKRMFNHGMVLDDRGDAMSKSLGNVVSPMVLMHEHGVDVLRLAMMFLAPSEKEVMWSSKSIVGVEKFLNKKFYHLLDVYQDTCLDLKEHLKSGAFSKSDNKLYVKLNQTIKKVSESIEKLQFNTAISALMELTRDLDLSESTNENLRDRVVLSAVQLIAPLAPHMAEQMWSECGQPGSVFKSNWPEYDPEAIVGDMITLAVQINGKLRDTIEMSADSTQEEIEKSALDRDKIRSYIGDNIVVKKIYVPGRLLNLVVKS